MHPNHCFWQLLEQFKLAPDVFQTLKYALQALQEGSNALSKAHKMQSRLLKNAFQAHLTPPKGVVEAFKTCMQPNHCFCQLLKPFKMTPDVFQTSHKRYTSIQIRFQQLTRCNQDGSKALSSTLDASKEYC